MSETDGGDIQAEARAAGTPSNVHRRVVPCFLFSLNFPSFSSIFFPFQFPSTFSSYTAERVLHLVYLRYRDVLTSM